jgi:hypothetical protein
MSNTQEQLIGQVRNAVEAMEAAVEALSVDEQSNVAFFSWFDTADHDSFEIEHDESTDFVVMSEELREVAREYLDDVLSIEGVWQGGSKDDAEYRGCEVLIACGGPNIRLTTHDGYVKGHWGGDEVTRSMDSSVCDYYDQMMEDGPNFSSDRG